MLSCVELSVDDTNTTAVAILETDKEGAAAFDELQSVSAKNLAISKAAAAGLSSPGLSEMGTPAPFAVTEDGKPVSSPEDKIGKWRISYRMTRKLV